MSRSIFSGFLAKVVLTLAEGPEVNFSSHLKHRLRFFVEDLSTFVAKYNFYSRLIARACRSKLHIFGSNRNSSSM